MEHDVVPLGERHAPHNFEYADETARLAATVSDSKWVNAMALQLDDGSYWRVASVSPATWEPVGAAGGTPAWADITGKPSNFPPSTHSHAISDVTDLQDELDAKQATLVNQANIKSINGVSLLGAGNMTISGGGGGSSTWTDITDKPTTLTGYGITDAEPSIAKATGYAKWTGSAWSFSNETYMQTIHDANAVTAAAISNWNTAFGWGDHAAAGYTNNLGTVTSVAALTLGTIGTDVSSSVATGTSTPVITLNVPTASASNRGALSAADWSTFNGKQAALGYTPANVSNNLSDLTDAGTARTSLGLGTLATQSGTFSGTSSGTNTGDQATVTGNAGTATALQTSRTIDGIAFDGTANITVVAPATFAATSKSTPVDDDSIPLVDSAASNGLKKLTWANIKATLKTYFDTLYIFSGGSLSGCTLDGTNAVGFLGIPQVSQSAAYTLVLADAGKHILHPSADTTARTFTIPANVSVAFPIGTAITFVNQNAGGDITVAITTDTMRLVGAGITGSRTLAANGAATAVKVTANEWLISGINLT